MSVHLRSAVGRLSAGVTGLGQLFTYSWDLIGRNGQALPHMVSHPQGTTGACSNEGGGGPRKRKDVQAQTWSDTTPNTSTDQSKYRGQPGFKAGCGAIRCHLMHNHITEGHVCGHFWKQSSKKQQPLKNLGNKGMHEHMIYGITLG